MARKRKLDNIERDVILAERLGYGCHYGRYKADHPHTRVEEESAVEVKPLPDSLKPCRFCGKLFDPEMQGHTKARAFCSYECQCESDRIRSRNYYHRKEITNAT